jgi:hypothetical protein
VAKSRLSPLRTLGLSVALAAPIAVGLYLEAEYRPATGVHAAASLMETPWLTFPGEFQRLSSPQTRRDLLDFMINERSLMAPSRVPNLDLYESAVFECDEKSLVDGTDVLQLWTLGAFEPSRRVELRVREPLADIEFTRWDYVPPPPSTIDHTSDATVAEVEPERRQISGVPTSDLVAVRDAWTASELWQASRTESSPDCLDGDVHIVSACVGGEFAVHFHHCGSKQAESAYRLLDLLQPFSARATEVN